MHCSAGARSDEVVGALVRRLSIRTPGTGDTH